MLGKFLDRENIPRIERDVIDKIFRRLRRLAGFETMITVLVSRVHCAALLRGSPRTQRNVRCSARCGRRIQRDEDMHYCYQGYTLGFFSRARGFWSESLVRSLHRLLVLAPDGRLHHHRALFRAAGFSLARFLGMAFQALAQVEQRLGTNVIVGIALVESAPLGTARTRPCGRLIAQPKTSAECTSSRSIVPDHSPAFHAPAAGLAPGSSVTVPGCAGRRNRTAMGPTGGMKSTAV